MPVVKNSTRNIRKKPVKLPPEGPLGRKYSTPMTASAMTMKFQNVTFAPPSLSDSQPPNGRISAPTSGPSQA